MPADHSSHGLVPTDRAPRLRRVADLVTARADACPHPAEAFELARKMRVRAARLELGETAEDFDVEAALDLFRSVAA